MDFDTVADAGEREVTREPHPDNIIHDIVEYSRSKQVLNEEQTVVTLLIYATGWLENWSDYAGGVITGGSAGGKSHMKQNVIDSLFAYVDDALYSPTGFSPTAIQDDPEWDRSMVAALNELQKIPDEVLEFLKSAHGDDGGFDYRRNVSDPDSESGFSAKQLTSEPKPTVFMLADENTFDVEAELRTRLIEIKVDETEEKNEGVHKMKWGHQNIELPSSDQMYIWDDDELDHMVRSHIRDMPKDMDVVIPTGDGRYDGDDWDAASVVAPLFTFKRSESSRASSMLASLVKASALLNYHARDTVEIDGDEMIVAEPMDVANIIFCRETLLATTHGLTEKKFALLDAIMERGGQANPKGTAVQATKDSIIEEIQHNPEIATMSKSEITELLDELDEKLIINKTDNPEDRRENLYVYDGSATFKKPDIYRCYDKFEDIIDPIRDQPIEETIEEQLDKLNARMDMGAMASSEPKSDDTESDSKGAEGGLAAFEKDSGPGGKPLTDTAQYARERVSATLDGKWVPARVMESSALKTEHMIGEVPVEVEKGVNGADETVEMVVPERQPTGADRQDGPLSPDNPLWADRDDIHDHGDVEDELDAAIEELFSAGYLQFDMDEAGNAEVTVK